LRERLTCAGRTSHAGTMPHNGMEVTPPIGVVPIRGVALPA
jgi:hypothetical protein